MSRCDNQALAEIVAWIGEHAKKRSRPDIVIWNNRERDLRLSDLTPELQEYMEDYIAEFIPRKTSLIPSFTEVMPSLLDGLARARAAGLAVSGFDSMCGLPLCMVPEARKARAVRATLEGPVTPMVPASILKEHPNTTLYLDKDSASLLHAN